MAISHRRRLASSKKCGEWALAIGEDLLVVPCNLSCALRKNPKSMAPSAGVQSFAELPVFYVLFISPCSWLCDEDKPDANGALRYFITHKSWQHNVRYALTAFIAFVKTFDHLCRGSGCSMTRKLHRKAMNCTAENNSLPISATTHKILTTEPFLESSSTEKAQVLWCVSRSQLYQCSATGSKARTVLGWRGRASTSGHHTFTLLKGKTKNML